ncbi:hypothetical protein Ahu01nite_100410 [Winogradskya humida]|uniref:Secreted protein n=1 Tax=Winogradskya humida TaxID=113566 RepID=A0ABQ4A7Y7_9ACTN|nr:hypothetical protein Ahu01nite_100410 [Actinoplanes humidus]
MQRCCYFLEEIVAIILLFTEFKTSVPSDGVANLMSDLLLGDRLLRTPWPVGSRFYRIVRDQTLSPHADLAGKFIAGFRHG